MEKPELKSLVEEIKSKGYDPTVFRFDNNKERLILHLKSEPRLWFRFNSSPNEFHQFTMVFSLYRPDFREQTKYGNSWNNTRGALDIFNVWLTDDVRQYLAVSAMPDPLEEFNQKSDFQFDVNAENSLDNFNAQEKEHYRNSLAEFKKLIEANYKLTAELKDFVELKTKYLEARLDTHNKQDWIAVAKKLLTDIGISLTAGLILEGAKASIEIKIPPLFLELVMKAFRGFVIYLNQ